MARVFPVRGFFGLYVGYLLGVGCESLLCSCPASVLNKFIRPVCRGLLGTGCETPLHECPVGVTLACMRDFLMQGAAWGSSVACPSVHVFCRELQRHRNAS